MAEHSNCLLNCREIHNVHPPLFLVVSVGFVKDSESVNEVNLVAVVQVEISGSRSQPVTVRSVKYLSLLFVSSSCMLEWMMIMFYVMCRFFILFLCFSVFFVFCINFYHVYTVCELSNATSILFASYLCILCCLFNSLF